MIQLEETTIWSKLSSPYGNSVEIPTLIIELSKTNKKEVADELIWEYIYHQGSTYENTLATLPHLLKIIKESNDEVFKMDLVLSLGIVLIGYEETSDLNGVFKTNNLTDETQNRIKIAFKNALKEFKNIVDNSFSNINSLDESSKRYFLITYLVTRGKHHEAEIFITFSENDEYIFVCPNCNEETFLWNEENVLNAYDKDPTFNKDRKQIKIDVNNSNPDLNWLEELIIKININSLRSLLPYFKGHMNCYHCKEQSNIFDGVLNSI